MGNEPILVVDDNEANKKLLAFILSSRGYAVRAAASASEAQVVLESFRPRLILLDIQMPGLDGLSFARQLRATPAFAGVAIVAVTAYAMKGDAEKARAAGCDGYITKPIDTRALPALVEGYLTRSGGSRT